VRRVQTLGNSETNVWRVAIISALDIITCRWWSGLLLLASSRPGGGNAGRTGTGSGYRGDCCVLGSPCKYTGSAHHATIKLPAVMMRSHSYRLKIPLLPERAAKLSPQTPLTRKTRCLVVFYGTIMPILGPHCLQHRLRSQCPRPAAQSCTLQDPCPPRSRHGNRRLPDSLPKSVQCEGRGEGNCGCL
jgi:hypothetical protein